jgi:protein required for attachment to host cells
MKSTWVLVADRARARLFKLVGEGSQLDELRSFANPEARTPTAEMVRDRKPRTQESMGSARHAIEPHTTLEETISERFARELEAVLEEGRVQHRYERLVLVAPPGFLGTLNQALGKQVLGHVVLEVNKDLCAMPPHEIHAHLASQLPA